MNDYTRNKTTRTEKDKSGKPSEDRSITELEDRAADTLDERSIGMGDTPFIEMVQMREAKVERRDEYELRNGRVDSQVCGRRVDRMRVGILGVQGGRWKR